MTSRRGRSVLKSTVVAAWLVGALTLGRLVSEYVPMGMPSKTGVHGARDNSYAKIVPRRASAALSPVPTSVDEAQQDIASYFFSGLLAAGLGAACLACGATMHGIGVPPVTSSVVATHSPLEKSQVRSAKDSSMEAAKAVIASFATAALVRSQMEAEKLEPSVTDSKTLSYVNSYVRMAKQSMESRTETRKARDVDKIFQGGTEALRKASRTPGTWSSEQKAAMKNFLMTRR
mmetsp:Transcript_17618/g.30867  ORF Transcript_17618/g.30867 Transcript_17618/m.30867 type:complete len:232 (-) Transcript_17618:86-781(-)